MNQAEIHTINTSPAEAEIRVKRFLGHLFLQMYLHGCACLCEQRKKEKGYIAAKAEETWEIT